MIKFNIQEIAKNKNIQKSISAETLFIIGTIYGQYQDALLKYKVKIIDLANLTVTIENSEEKIIIKISELLQDKELINQIDQCDLLRIIGPYSYKQGYQAHAQTLENDSIEEEEDKPTELHNIINFTKL